jgi:hypothetical protein
LLSVLLVFAAGECLVAGNLPAAAFLSAIALAIFFVKLRAIAHRQEPDGAGRACSGGK